MLAALHMYDRAETRDANDRLWTLIRQALGDGPETLSRDRDPWEIWQSPDLILSQTCGLPFRARLHDRVTLVGTPDYGLPGAGPGYYYSVIVVRADDPRRDLAEFAQGVLAFNDPLSQSGWAAVQAHLAGRGLAPARLLQSGAHAASARAVAEGRADFAALDAVSWALMQRHDDFPRRLRVLEHTRPTPGLPLITARDRDGPRLFRAVEQAIAALDAGDRETLHLVGLSRIPAELYLAEAIPPAPAI